LQTAANLILQAYSGGLENGKEGAKGKWIISSLLVKATNLAIHSKYKLRVK